MLTNALKILDDFKNKQQKCMKKCFLKCKVMYILKVYSVQYTLRQNTNLKKKFYSGKINGTKKYPLFSLANSNSLRF